ncbi:MAG: GldG family protein [Planctomycetota bacterium]
MNRFDLIFNKTVQFVCLVIIVLAGYSLLELTHTQYDATEEKLIQLSPESIGIIDSLNPKKKVLIRAFFSSEVPHELVETKENLVNFLNQFERVSNGKVQVAITYLDADTQAAFETEKNYDIKAREMMDTYNGAARPMKVYMALVFSCGLKEHTIPFFERGMSEELEIARNIKVVNGDIPKKIGVLYTDAKLMGDFDMNTFQSIPAWEFVQELQKQYDVVGVSPEGLQKYYYDGGRDLKPGDKFDVLIAPMPSTLSAKDLYYLHQYIWTGAPVLILDDPWPTFNARLAPQMPKLRPQYPGQPPSMGATPPKCDIQKLFDCMGVHWNDDDVVWGKYNPHPTLPIEDLHVFFLGPKVPETNSTDNTVTFRSCYPKDSEITHNLQEMLMLCPGGISKTANPPAGIEFKPLLYSPVPCGHHTVQEAFPAAFNHDQEQDQEEPNLTYYSASQDPTVLAAEITGHMRNAFPEGQPKTPGDSSTPDPDADKYKDPKKQPPANADGLSQADIHVIFIPDIDMVSDQFFDFARRVPEFNGVKLDFDNTRFVLNCVDELAGDKTFVALRNRRPIHRPMERMDAIAKQMGNESSKQFDKDQAKVKAQIQDINDQTRKVQKDIESRTDLSENEKQVLLQKKYKYAQDTANKQIKQFNLNLKHEKDQDMAELTMKIDRLHFIVQLYPIIASVAFVLVIGLIVGLMRFFGERTDIPAARKRV